MDFVYVNLHYHATCMYNIIVDDQPPSDTVSFGVTLSPLNCNNDCMYYYMY